jgi:hypothetical protein
MKVENRKKYALAETLCLKSPFQERIGFRNQIILILRHLKRPLQIKSPTYEFICQEANGCFNE